MRSTVCEGLVGAVDALVALVLDGSARDGLCVAELQHLTGQVADVKGRLAGVEVALVGALEARSGGKVPSEPVRPPTAPDVVDPADSVSDADVDAAEEDAADPDAHAHADAGDPAEADAAPGPSVLVRHWLRDRTGCDGGEAGRQVRLAVELRGLPLVLAAVLDGRLSLAHARVLCRLVGQIDPVALAQAEPNLLAVAAERDPVELAAYVRHQLASWCEPQFEADQRAQEQRRYLQTWREADGMLAGRFRLTSTDSEELLTVLEPLARPSGLADSRSAGQRRADALSELCRQVLGFGDLPDAGGFRPQVSYVVPAGWAAGHRPTGSPAGSSPDGGAFGPYGPSPVGTFADLVGASLAAGVLGDQGLGPAG